MNDGRSVAELGSLERDPDSGTYSATYDPERTSPSMAAVAMISAVVDCDPTDVEPLQSAIDADALNEIVRRDANESTDVTFSLHGHTVTVDSSGEVTVGPTAR